LKRKATCSALFTLIFLILLVSCTQIVIVAFANPIPIPTLLMPVEYINVTLTSVSEPAGVLARVDGVYPFTNVGYQTVVMEYPVPTNATNITVKKNGTSLDWVYDTKVYPTVIGDWPMINWTISLAPIEHFQIETHYEHFVPEIDENCTFLYAMGTGRFLETYAKQTTAYVRVRMETNFTCLQVCLVGEAVNDTWMSRPAPYQIVLEGTTNVITVNMTSSLFRPLIEDLQVTFCPERGLLEDINHDGKVDIKDVYAVGKAYGSYPGHPKWNPIRDINGDYKVDIKDYYMVCKSYGKTCP
jgi:hypothetical protein